MTEVSVFPPAGGLLSSSILTDNLEEFFPFHGINMPNMSYNCNGMENISVDRS